MSRQRKERPRIADLRSSRDRFHRSLYRPSLASEQLRDLSVQLQAEIAPKTCKARVRGKRRTRFSRLESRFACFLRRLAFEYRFHLSNCVLLLCLRVNCVCETSTCPTLREINLSRFAFHSTLPIHVIVTMDPFEVCPSPRMPTLTRSQPLLARFECSSSP